MAGRRQQAADVTLPIKDILNANPVWVRTEWPNPTRLKRSLSNEGMHVPVLLNHDWEVIDGARRVLAAKDLGWDRVPVQVTGTWPDVVQYFQEVRELDKVDFPAAPMRWLESYDLITRILQPIFRPYSLNLGTMRRRQGLGRDPGVNRSGGRLHQGLTEMLALTAPSVPIVQVGHALAKARREHGAQFEAELRATVERMEKTTGQVWAADDVVRSAIKISQIPVLASDEKLAAEQTAKLGRIMQVLEVGTTELKTLGDLNVAVDTAFAQTSIVKLRPVIKAANALLRALETHIEVVNSKETEQ